MVYIFGKVYNVNNGTFGFGLNYIIIAGHTSQQIVTCRTAVALELDLCDMEKGQY